MKTDARFVCRVFALCTIALFAVRTVSPAATKAPPPTWQQGSLVSFTTAVNGTACCHTASRRSETPGAPGASGSMSGTANTATVRPVVAFTWPGNAPSAPRQRPLPALHRRPPAPHPARPSAARRSPGYVSLPDAHSPSQSRSRPQTGALFSCLKIRFAVCHCFSSFRMASMTPTHGPAEAT